MTLVAGCLCKSCSPKVSRSRRTTAEPTSISLALAATGSSSRRKAKIEALPIDGSSPARTSSVAVTNPCSTPKASTSSSGTSSSRKAKYLPIPMPKAPSGTKTSSSRATRHDTSPTNGSSTTAKPSTRCTIPGATPKPYPAPGGRSKKALAGEETKLLSLARANASPSSKSSGRAKATGSSSPILRASSPTGTFSRRSRVIKFDSNPYDQLRLRAELFNDAQEARILTEQRVNHVDTIVIDKELLDECKAVKVNGEVTLQHLPSRERENKLRARLIEQYLGVAPPAIVEWQDDNKGLGESGIARLLGHLGHPVIAVPHHWEGKGTKRQLIQDPLYIRTAAQLRQLCGHGDPHRRPFEGISAEELASLGSPMLKKLVFLVSSNVIKEIGRKLDNLFTVSEPAERRYRRVYEDRRKATWEKLHSDICKRCGPSGKPAQVGSKWSDGHKHADALRIVGKAILDDMYTVTYEAGGF